MILHKKKKKSTFEVFEVVLSSILMIFFAVQIFKISNIYEKNQKRVDAAIEDMEKELEEYEKQKKERIEFVKNTIELVSKEKVNGDVIRYEETRVKTDSYSNPIYSPIPMPFPMPMPISMNIFNPKTVKADYSTYECEIAYKEFKRSYTDGFTYKHIKENQYKNTIDMYLYTIKNKNTNEEYQFISFDEDIEDEYNYIYLNFFDTKE